MMGRFIIPYNFLHFQMQATSYLQYPPHYQISTVQIMIIVNIYAHDTTMHVYNTKKKLYSSIVLF